MLIFNDKQQLFVNILLNAKEPINNTEMQKLLHSSKRTIYNIVNKVNDELISQSIDPIYNQRGKGYYLTNKQKADIQKSLSFEYTPFLSARYRASYLACWLLYPKGIVHLNDMMKILDVSRNTIFNDLKKVKQLLEPYGITLEFDIKKGYTTHGTTLNNHSFLMNYMGPLLKKIYYKNLNFINVTEAESYYNRLIKISNELGNAYDLDNLLTIACTFSIIHDEHEQFQFSLFELKDLVNTKELEYIDAYFQDFEIHERLYLAIYLLGTKASRTLDTGKNDHNILLLQLSQTLIQEFEQITLNTVMNQTELLNSLYMHFKLSLYYYKLSIHIPNPLKEDVIENYRDLYEIIKTICEKHRNDFPFPLSTGEIVYITMHFGGHLKQGPGKFYRNIKVLIVCPSGIATSTLLSREVENLYANVSVVAATAASLIDEYKEEIDFIVSTVDLNTNLPWVKVNPILTKADKSKIASMMMINFEVYQIDEQKMSGLFDILSKYVNTNQMEQLKQDIYSYLNSGNSIVKVENNAEDIHLFTILKVDQIQIWEREIDWQQGIKEASLPLLKKGIINIEYIDSMISLVNQYGAYFILQNGVAVAHGKPEEGAKALGISLLINHQFITFDDNRKVKYLFVLSNPDTSKHFQLLKEIMIISQNKSLLNALDKIYDKEEMMDIIKNCIINTK